MTKFDPELAIIWYGMFIVATTFHEAAHAFVAAKGGDLTGEQQITLNPIPHIKREPFGMVIIPIFSFLSSGGMIGWASTPYNLLWALKNPHKSALMAIAGPISNFLLMLLFLFSIYITKQVGTISLDGSMFFTSLVIGFQLNLTLTLLNMIPIPPLDGGHAIALFMPKKLARIWIQNITKPVISAIGFVLAWTFFNKFHAYIMKALVKFFFN